MKYTCAQAAKLLKRLNERLNEVKAMEQQTKSFVASLGEDPESVRPEYDYAATAGLIDGLEEKIRKVKHAVNVFNTTHTVPGFDMTVDQILVYIPQLTERKEKLRTMASALPKSRQQSFSGSSVVDYSYANYDPRLAASDLEKVSAALSDAQTALDLVNSTETLELDI